MFKVKNFFKRTIKHLKWRYLITLIFCLGFISSVYAAGDVGAIEKAIQGIRDLLTGPIAKSLAVIAIIGVGYMTLAGKLAWKIAMMVCLGTGIVFGANEIAALLGAS